MIDLSIGPSLAISSSLKAHVSDLHWWLLSLRPYLLEEVDLILQSQDWGSLSQLSWNSRHWDSPAFVVVFLSLSSASLRSLALLGSHSTSAWPMTPPFTQPGEDGIPLLTDISIFDLTNGFSEDTILDSKRHTVNSLKSLSTFLDPEPPDTIPKPGSICHADDPVMFEENMEESTLYFTRQCCPSGNVALLAESLCFHFHPLRRLGGDSGRRRSHPNHYGSTPGPCQPNDLDTGLVRRQFYHVSQRPSIQTGAQLGCRGDA